MTAARTAPVIARHLAIAADNRERAEQLVAGIEALFRKFGDLNVVPLDVLDRCERAVVEAHTSNLLRLTTYRLDEDER